MNYGNVLISVPAAYCFDFQDFQKFWKFRTTFDIVPWWQVLKPSSDDPDWADLRVVVSTTLQGGYDSKMSDSDEVTYSDNEG